MMIRIGAVLAAVLLVGTGCSGEPVRDAQPPAVSASLDQAQSDKLHTAITGAMASAGIPGALVGIWSPAGNYVQAFGVADTATNVPMATGFYSRIGSVTKTFTATGVLQLVDRASVGLDDPISKYVADVPGGESISVRQLLTMRSGLADYTNTEAFENAVAADPYRHYPPQELLGFAFAEPAEFSPGAKFQYTNTNYILLGLLIEKVSGKSLTDYLTEQIFGPLGLSHTSFPSGTQFPTPHAQGYTEPVEDDNPPLIATDWTASFTWAAGAVISTLDDMHTWVRTLATGELISPALQAQRLQSPPVPGLPPGIGYGMGVLTTAGWVGHNGSVPGYQTVAIYLPARQVTVVTMVNTDIVAEGRPMPSTALTKAITSVLTPDHVYDV